MADAAFCISLQERPDRFAAACAQAHDWGLCRVMMFYRPRRSTVGERARDAVSPSCAGPQGIWESHRAVCRLAADRGLQRTLIFEDDFHMLQKQVRPERLRKVGRDVRRLPDGWDTMFLGHAPIFGLPVAGLWPPCVFRTWSMLAHAYVMSAKGTRKLAGCSYVDARRRSGRPRILDAWMQHNFRCYAVYPQMVVQAPELGSDDGVPGSFWDRAGAVWMPFWANHTLLLDTCVFFLVPMLIVLFLAVSLAFIRRRIVSQPKF